MRLILFSDPEQNEAEMTLLADLEAISLFAFHLRKPNYSESELGDYIKALPPEIQKKTVIHSHFNLALKFPVKGIHLPEKVRMKQQTEKIPISENLKIISTSFHKISDLDQAHLFEYVFLSPVFDSISKKDYKSPFQLDELKTAIASASTPVIALGGIRHSNILQCEKTGFSGIALLGSVWKSEHPLESFQKISELVGKLKQKGN